MVGVGSYLAALWAYVAGKLTAWLTPDRATRVRRLPAADGHTLVTFRYRRQAYRGHALPGATLRPEPWYSGARRCLKRPVAAVDRTGADVLPAVLPFWGPAGCWNAQVGLTFVPRLEPGVQPPVTVGFNSGAVVVVG